MGMNMNMNRIETQTSQLRQRSCTEFHDLHSGYLRLPDAAVFGLKDVAWEATPAGPDRLTGPMLPTTDVPLPGHTPFALGPMMARSAVLR